MTGHLTANGFRFRQVRPIDHVFRRHQLALYRRKSTARGKRVRKETPLSEGHCVEAGIVKEETPTTCCVLSLQVPNPGHNLIPLNFSS